MSLHNFTITAQCGDAARDYDAIVDALYEAGCDDALVLERAGVFVIEFDRDAPTLKAAIASGLANVTAAGLVPLRVGPDSLVSAADIAQRFNVTRQAVSYYVSGKRGSGFPPPAARADTPSPLWHMADVAAWFAHGNAKHRRDVVQASRIDRVNRQLAARVAA